MDATLKITSKNAYITPAEMECVGISTDGSYLFVDYPEGLTVIFNDAGREIFRVERNLNWLQKIWRKIAKRIAGKSL